MTLINQFISVRIIYFPQTSIMHHHKQTRLYSFLYRKSNTWKQLKW